MDIDKVLQKLHIEELNDMQKNACVTILGSTDDVVILSPTGSGKTLAYLLPTAHLVDDEHSDGVGRDIAFLQMVDETSWCAEDDVWQDLLKCLVFLHGRSSAIAAGCPHSASHGF